MSANAASTASCGEDGAAGSVLFTPPQPTDEALPDAQPGSQLAYEETEPIQGLCRLPSPGKLWSDSEEVSGLLPRVIIFAFTALNDSRKVTRAQTWRNGNLQKVVLPKT